MRFILELNSKYCSNQILSSNVQENGQAELRSNFSMALRGAFIEKIKIEFQFRDATTATYVKKDQTATTVTTIIR